MSITDELAARAAAAAQARAMSPADAREYMRALALNVVLEGMAVAGRDRFTPDDAADSAIIHNTLLGTLGQAGIDQPKQPTQVQGQPPAGTATAMGLAAVAEEIG